MNPILPAIVQPDDDGIRPVGKPDECLYCSRKIGQPHGDECVIVERTIVVRLEAEFTVRVPNGWTPEQYEIARNHTGNCLNNQMREWDGALRHRFPGWTDEDIGPDDISLDACDYMRVRYVREATEEDEDRDGVHLPKSTSYADRHCGPRIEVRLLDAPDETP